MHTHLSVNPRALDADQDAQVNGEPSGICRDKTARLMCISCLSSPPAPHPRAQVPQQGRGEWQDPRCLQVSRSWKPQSAGLSSACPAGRRPSGPTAMGSLSQGVAALPVPRHASDLLDDGPGQLLLAGLPSTLCLAEGHVQCLLLAVAEDRHPAARAESGLGAGYHAAALGLQGEEGSGAHPTAAGEIPLCPSLHSSHHT